MRDLEPPFKLSFGDQLLRIAEHELGSKRVFYVDFGAGTRPLVITVSISPWNKKFWTSIPEGRQAEAEQIGKLIAEHIRAKRR